MHRAFVQVLVGVALTLLLPSLARADTWYMLVGSSVQTFDHAPVVRQDGGEYITLAALAATGAPVKQVYTLGSHKLGIAMGQPLQLDGKPLPAADVLESGPRYLSLRVMERLGFHLAFHPLHNLYQLVGEVHRADYSSATGELALDCLTPVSVSGVQPKDDGALVQLTIDGGWIGERAVRELPADPLLSRLGYKSQPELGRSTVFARQPKRVGFSIATPSATAARVRFGNFAALKRYAQSSNGELGITIELGAKVAPRAQLLDNPARLVVDFPGVQVVATESVPVKIGRATKLQLSETQDGARLTVSLSSRADYRVLSGGGGTRQHIQLLPYAGASGAQRRSGRAIMLDSGHGGSDTGAIGVEGGIYEKKLNDQITALLAAELKRMGYTVLHTRTTDRFVTLGSRGDYANLTLPWLFASIHCNSFHPDHQGVITFVHPDSGTDSRRAAQLVHEEFLASTGAKDKQVREEDFFVLRETVVPSILIECGSMSNTEECGKLCDPIYQQKIALGIARGIDRFVTGL